MAEPVVEASKAHEELCTNCGKCCYQKVIIGRSVFITPFPCEFLNTETNLCTIYDRRHELNPTCLTVEQGLKVSAFPSDCGYVKEKAPKNYKAAREDLDMAAEWDDYDGLADDMEVSPEMRELIRARGPHAPPMYVEVNARMERERAARTQQAGPADALIWGDSGRVADLSRQRAEPAPQLIDLLKSVGEARQRMKNAAASGPSLAPPSEEGQ